MPWTLVAYSKSVAGADAVNAITPVVDQTYAADGDFFRIQADRNQIMAVGFLMSAGGTQLSRINAASILNRLGGPLNVAPRVNALVWGSPPEILFFPRNPIPLRVNEGVSLEQRSSPAAAERQYGLLWLSSGPVEPIAGAIVSLRFTAAITLAAGAWVNGAITLAQPLPPGDYGVAGLRIEGANLVAARLVPVRGGDNRPGAPALTTAARLDDRYSRFGVLGTWFTFPNTAVPSLDALGVTDTSQTGYLDLITAG